MIKLEQVATGNDDIPPLIFSRTLADGFTQSEFTDMGCFQRWNYRYNQLLQSKSNEPMYFKLGTAFHDAMEQFYRTKGARINVATLQFESHEIPSLKEIEKLNYWNAVLPAMFDAYAIYYKTDPIRWTIEKLEEEMDVTYRGFRVRGKIDLTAFISKFSKWIWDHKSAFRLDVSLVAGWDFRFQFMFYIWLKWLAEPNNKLTGYLVNAVKKPELRVKQNESLPAHAARVREDMIHNPDKYFYRSEYPVTKDAIQHFQKEIVDPTLDKLQFICENPGHPLAKALMKEKNTSECQKWGGRPCEFLDLCRYGDRMKHLFVPREQKHAELNEELN